MFNLFTARLYVPMLFILPSMHVSVSDLSIYMIYCRSFNFPYIICQFLYLHTWTTSLDHVHIYLLCTPFGFIICTHRVASNNLGFSCPDQRHWTLVALL